VCAYRSDCDVAVVIGRITAGDDLLGGMDLIEHVLKRHRLIAVLAAYFLDRPLQESFDDDFLHRTFVGDLDRYFRAFGAADGEVLWEVRLPTSVQGFPVSFAVDGVQYVAVSTGIGGGSPRMVPRMLAPEVRHPRSGNALYVFKLAKR